ncbi:hypothetical protein MAR_038359, partial [Mya arenaria]
RLTIFANVVEDVTGVNISAESFINVRPYDVAGEITRYSGDLYPGNASADIDVSLFYNIFIDLEDQDLRLEVDVIKESVNGFTVRSCISWLEEDISGMVVAEIGIPSGFNAFRYGISGHELLMRTEIQEKKVVLYLDQV